LRTRGRKTLAVAGAGLLLALAARPAPAARGGEEVDLPPVSFPAVLPAPAPAAPAFPLYRPDDPAASSGKAAAGPPPATRASPDGAFRPASDAGDPGPARKGPWPPLALEPFEYRTAPPRQDPGPR